VFGFDLVALGTFLSMANAPLYIYILGRSYRGASKPEEKIDEPSI